MGLSISRAMSQGKKIALDKRAYCAKHRVGLAQGPVLLTAPALEAKVVIEVFSRRNASNVLQVMWTLGELQLPYKRHAVGGSFGGTKTPEYLAMNPNARIPTIKDGDFVLWESNAIVRYLCRRYGEGALLLQNDVVTYALADQWMDWYKTTLYPVYIDLVWAIVRTEPTLRNHRKISDLKSLTEDRLSILDQQLGKDGFVIGSKFSMADIPFGGLVFRYLSLEINRPRFLNIETWYKQLCERPAYQEHVMLPFGSEPGEWYRLEREYA